MIPLSIVPAPTLEEMDDKTTRSLPIADLDEKHMEHRRPTHLDMCMKRMRGASLWWTVGLGRVRERRCLLGVRGEEGSPRLVEREDGGLHSRQEVVSLGVVVGAVVGMGIPIGIK